MAGGRQQLTAKHAAHRLFTPTAAGFDADEFEESDVWGSPIEPRLAEFPKPAPSSRPSSARSKKADRAVADAAAAASLPVNIPDWSKILGSYYGGGSSNSARGWWEEEGEEGGAGGPMIPPHELLWRSRAASFSVHEGVGCTLKGRDLRRVRNAIWEKTGFQD
ncbi:protein S40-4 [Musa acuminata AAA Group]|uniref:protein S40-4 n=1 Tax=Musa acuminata AAA Group TaxID=214697 RepID=UPI0031CE7021